MDYKATKGTDLPVSLEFVKVHLRVDHTDDDDYITSLINAAADYCSSYTQRALLTTNVVAICDSFQKTLELPLSPCQSIESVIYLDSSGSEQTLDASKYKLNTYAEPSTFVMLNGWPDTLWQFDAVKITYTSGYESADDIPAQIKQAILLIVGHYYENREESVKGTIISEIPLASKYLLDQVRIY